MANLGLRRTLVRIDWPVHVVMTGVVYAIRNVDDVGLHGGEYGFMSYPRLVSLGKVVEAFFLICHHEVLDGCTCFRHCVPFFVSRFQVMRRPQIRLFIRIFIAISLKST